MGQITFLLDLFFKTFSITPTILELFGDKSWTAFSGLATMSGFAFNLHFAFALKGGYFISSQSGSIDSIRRSEKVETRSTMGIKATRSLLLGMILGEDELASTISFSLACGVNA